MIETPRITSRGGYKFGLGIRVYHCTCPIAWNGLPVAKVIGRKVNIDGNDHTVLHISRPPMPAEMYVGQEIGIGVTCPNY